MTPILPVVEGHEDRQTTFAEDQPQYNNLPALKCGDECGTVISRWRLDADELAEINRTGCIFISMQTFGTPLQPVLPSAFPPDVPPAVEPVDVIAPGRSN